MKLFDLGKRIFYCVLYYGFARFLPLSYSPGGKIAKAIRYAICRHLFGFCGNHVNIEPGARFRSGRHVFVGDYSDIGENARIMGSVTIGQNVMMAPDVLIVSCNHHFSRTDIPMNHQGLGKDQTIRVEDDVWIGARAILLPGVTVGRGSIIGAGAVVAKDVPAWSIAVGNPAYVVRNRKEAGEPVVA